MTSPSDSQSSRAGVVLVVDDDRDIASLVSAALTEDGFDVSILSTIESGPLMEAVAQIEPDCVLLDSSSLTDYGPSWDLAASLAVRPRPVPVIMFTGHRGAIVEAQDGTSNRSRAAAFSGVLSKPFDLDDLFGAVTKAVGRATPFDRSQSEESTRTKALVAELENLGVSDIATSGRREWVTFRVGSGNLIQLYWWQQLGVYLVGRYVGTSGVMEPLGEFANRDVAIKVALAS